MKNFLLLSLLIFATLTHSQPLDRLKDYRMCGVVVRDTNGNIKRSSAVLTAYKKIHPCPSTGLTTGACPGWALNHSIPLACGGCDAVYNLTWTPDQIKSCAEPWCIDRYERKINAATPPVPDSAACVNAFPVDLK
jgi:hypothetical protein